MNSLNGKILKSVGGFFHVETSDGVLLCTARGLFRLKNITPVAGDNVIVDISESTPVITDVLNRKNYIVRPPLANLDAVIIVISTVEPTPNRLILDKLIAIFESKEIEPVPIFTKIDRKDEDELREIYVKAGFTVFSISNNDNSGIEELRTFLSGKTYALIGNTGVGKSSTLNSLFPELALETAEISRKLGRGKHTTRQVELYGLGENGYIADTPGFSTVEAAKYGKLPSSDIGLYFREFIPFLADCKFAGCRHTGEEGCAVIKAKERGEITESRFCSYLRIYSDARKEEQNYK
ncbi:MAG: ribosome small subunit-dependent GTPase A [Oscillospiraceae bacterium]|jgi:ribosome biogenesis GTPase|nr:ribosome small subunit-dependent GTPase A [Oscillospiraceae bacterium]